jgi:hypothetical protein
MSDARSRSGYDIVVDESGEGWHVRIVDPTGVTAGERLFRDAAQARTYASTVRQHRYWLSPARFREYYGLREPSLGGS